MKNKAFVIGLFQLLIASSAVSLRADDSRRVFDFIVPDDGDIKTAIEAANHRSDTLQRYFIFVRRGDYVIPASTTATVSGMDGKEYPDPRTDLTASNVSIIGEGMDVTSVKNAPTSVVVDGRWGPACPIEGLKKVYTLKNSGKYNYFQDIKFVNGMDDARGRGEAYEESGDRTIMKNVGLWGYQDTYCSNYTGGLYYFEGGVIRGRTDYICGKGDIYFNGTEFRQCAKGGYILAPSVATKYGYVMRDCIISGENPDIDGTFTFGRPWGKGTPTAYWINTTCRVRPAERGWDEMSGGWPARFAEIGSVDSRGNDLYVGARKDIWQFKDGEAHQNNPILSENMAETLTVDEVLGNDGWAPQMLAMDAPLPCDVVLSQSQLSWSGSPEAIGYAVCKDGDVWQFTTDCRMEVPADGSIYAVRAVSPMGGLGKPVEAGKKVRIHTIGDSTMADYAEMTTKTRGWGEMLGEFFTDEASVIDYARGGRSSMSFIHEGRWDKVVDAIIPGDYVLIQFAHNDEHRGGIDGDDYRGTAPWTTYRDCLRKYVEDTRNAGGIPVFVTPIIRRYFQKDGSISAKGCHDLGSDGHSLNYVRVMKSVASEKDVPVVDLTSITKEYVEQLGDSLSKALLYVPTDNTHTQAAGAAIFARLAANEMQRQGILAEYIDAEKTIVVNPTAINFGDMYKGASKTLAFDVIALDLKSENGAITVTAPKGFMLSSSLDGKRIRKLEMPCSDEPTLQNTIYLHFTPKKTGTVREYLSVSDGNFTRTIPVKAVVKKATESERILLEPEPSNMRGLSMTDSGILPTTEAGVWPKEIDEVNDRYMEFIITATEGTMQISDATIGVNEGICYRVAVARGKDFYPRTDIGENRTGSSASPMNMPINVNLSPGESLHLRVYPWSPSGGNNVFKIEDLKIRGRLIR